MSLFHDRPLSRYEKRQLEAQRVALRVLADYGDDPASYGDRLLALCNGNSHLERAVAKQIDILSGRDKRQRKRRRYYAKAA